MRIECSDFHSLITNQRMRIGVFEYESLTTNETCAPRRLSGSRPWRASRALATPTRYAAIKTSPTMRIIDANMLDATYQKPSSTMGGDSARGCWCCSAGVESQPLYTTKIEILSAATRAPFGHQRDAFSLVVGKLQIKYRTCATFSNTRTKHVV